MSDFALLELERQLLAAAEGTHVRSAEPGLLRRAAQGIRQCMVERDQAREMREQERVRLAGELDVLSARLDRYREAMQLIASEGAELAHAVIAEDMERVTAGG